VHIHSSSLKYQEAFAILCHAMNRQPDKAVATNMFEAILRVTATVLPETVLSLLLWAFVLNYYSSVVSHFSTQILTSFYATDRVQCCAGVTIAACNAENAATDCHNEALRGCTATANICCCCGCTE